MIATLHSLSSGPAAHPTFPPGNLTLINGSLGEHSWRLAQRNVDEMEGREKCYIYNTTILCNKGLSTQLHSVKVKDRWVLLCAFITHAYGLLVKMAPVV